MNYMAINHAMEGLRFFSLLYSNASTSIPNGFGSACELGFDVHCISPFAGMAVPRGWIQRAGWGVCAIFHCGCISGAGWPTRRCNRRMYIHWSCYIKQSWGTMYEAWWLLEVADVADCRTFFHAVVVLGLVQRPDETIVCGYLAIIIFRRTSYEERTAERKTTFLSHKYIGVWNEEAMTRQEYSLFCRSHEHRNKLAWSSIK